MAVEEEDETRWTNCLRRLHKKDEDEVQVEEEEED